MWVIGEQRFSGRGHCSIDDPIVGALLATQLGIGGVFGLLLITSLIGFVTMAVFGIETRQRILEELSA